MKKILFLLFFLIASVALFAHTWEIRVKQNQNGTLTWYGQSYHGAGQCGFANSGISINGVNYNWTAEFSGSTLGLNASLFTVSPTYANCNCGRTSYGTVTTPYIGGNLSVTAYSTNACYSLYPDMPAGNGAFIPPPPPVCTSCPLTGWGNTVAASGNNNGTFCNPNDDYTTATINVNHLSCASITGDKQFRVIFDPSGSNVAYGPFNYSTGIQTNITINIPYGTSNSTPVKVIDDDFPCELTHGLSLPGGQYLGEKETVPPTIICPANITVGNNIGTCVATIAINNPTATDNCGTPSVSGIRSDALALTADYPKGITTIIWTATDASGNKKTCNQTVTVNDTQAPNAVTQNLTVFLNASGNASLTSEQVNNGSTDNCSTPSLSITPSSFDCSHVAGVSSAGNALQFNGGYMDVPNEASLNPLNEWTLETWVNTTGSGFQQGLIEKYDCDNNYGYLLRITSSNKIMAGVTSGCSFGGAFVTGNTTIVANTWYHISATFNRTGNVKLYINGVLEGTTPVGVISSSPSNGSLKIGARGNDANTRLAGFMDEVKVWSIERTQAQIQADMNKSLAGSETGLQAYYRFEEPIASNTVHDITPLTTTNTGNLIGTFSRIASTADIGHSNPVILTATDVNGNSATRTAFITVIDDILPTITCPAPIAVNNDPSQCGAVVSIISATATDNCGAPTVTGVRSDALALTAAYPVGVTTINWTATDNSGLKATCSQMIRVVDNTPPSIICPTSVTVQCASEVPDVSIGKVRTSDNCDGIVTVNWEGDEISDHTCENSFKIARTFKAIDAANNIATCTQTITVHDNTAPVIICTENIQVNNASNQCGADVTFSATATDNCSGTVSITYSTVSGSFFNVGTTSVTVTATDICGNSSNCSFDVTITDNELPVITCPTPLSIHTDLGVCGAKATFDVTATDNCSASVAFTSGLQSGSIFPVGSTTNVFTATDASGNTATCSFTVKVTDNELPVITCPTPLSINTDLGVCGAKATFVVTATDNCSATVAFTSGLQSGSVFPVGSTTNVFTATDASGNTAKCSFTVKVTDNELPVITCPTPLSINTNLGVCGAKATFDVTATDNCSATVAFTSGLQSGSVFPVGSTRNVFTATDASGNTATCSFTIKVIDNELPVITCPLSTSRNTNAGLCTYTVVGTEFNALATDNCRVTALTFTLSGATTGTGNSLTDVKLYKGTTTVTWTAVDAAGNTSTCSSTMNVNDDQNPTSYIIYATKEVKFGEYNYINGNIGVTAADGKASFKKYDVLNPYFVKAKNIEFDLPSSVANRIYSPATDGPNPQFFAYSGSTLGLSNYNVSSNTVLAGNYKDLTIKKGVVATLQGNNFGKISIEEGAQVTFSSAVINVEEIDIQGGKKSVNTTNVYFTNPSSVKVKGKVKIDADCRVNVNGPKVTFYVGDNTGDEEKFTVKGDNSQVTANVMIPNGKLKVNGGESRMSIMTGWYIVEKLESTGKYITWNTYDCSMPTPTHRPEKEKVTSEITAHVEPERNVITFVTNQGTNTGFWTVEKRNDGTGAFEKLEIRNNAQLKSALQYHTFYDKDASEGENFYRVKLTYLNGDVVYSAIKGVTNKKINDFTVYPNPAIDEAWIDLKSFEGRQVTLVLSDMAGKPVQQQVIQKATSAPYRIDIAHLPTGLYLIKVQAQGRRVLMRKIQVTK